VIEALAPAVGRAPAQDAGLLIDTAAVTLFTPWSRPLVHLGLEIVVVGVGLGTLAHALRAHRRGELLPLFTFATILVYGLTMELLSYNFLDNFEHAQFSVMFYHRKLPLYVTAVYPALLYTGIAMARRLQFPRWAEGFAAGLLVVAMDVPFDVAGPSVGWWRWSATDPLLAARWCGVPVTSYYWHLAFGGALAALTTAIAPHLHTTKGLLLSFPAALMTIVVGVITFLPLHGLAALGVSHGAVVACAWAVCLTISIAAPRRSVASGDVLLFALVATFYAFHAIVAATALRPAHQVFVFAAMVFTAAVNVAGHVSFRARHERAAAR
jgi:hypothetical protein